MATERNTGFDRVGPTGLQLVPPSLLSNRPPVVAACSVEGCARSIPSALIARLPSPVLLADQVSPQSVLLKTPPDPVPAYRVDGLTGSMARALTPREPRPMAF